MADVSAADVLAGARNLVRYGGILPEDEVLLLVTEQADDPLVVDALREAVGEVGSPLSILRVPTWSRALGRPPRVIEAVLPAVDVVIQQGMSLNAMASYVQRAMYERGTNIVVNMSRSAEALGSDLGRYPLDLFYAIGERVLHRMRHGARLRLTTKAGTDIAATIDARHIGGYFYPARTGGRGGSKAFPGGEFGIHPEDPCAGVLAVEALQPDLSPPEAILAEPLRVTVEDHWATRFEGPLADWVQELLDRRGDDRARYFGEIQWGIHPRSGVPGCRAASSPQVAHCSLGNCLPYGGRYHSRFQLPLFLFEPTVTVDGEPLIVDGRMPLLDDPELRALAGRYGDPDELLAVRPVPRTVRVFGR